jgi:DNA polymerase I-like protein with 3'-5' exonuclease and polymerase domains
MIDLKVVEKNYITVSEKNTLKLLFDEILNNKILAIDTETDSLNVRKGNIIGWSLCATPGKSFYFPTMVWNRELNQLENLFIGGASANSISKNLFRMLQEKKLVFHNGSFDGRFIKNFYGVNLIPSIWVDTGMLVHTVNEEGAFGYGNPFGLKSIAKMHQEDLGLDVDTEANQEQIILKESIKANGGSVTKDNFELYKADLDVICKYGAADTDLTLRISHLYLEKLKDEGLWDFFFEDEVMPIYREVTIPMEDRGVCVDLELLNRVKKEISEEMSNIKKGVEKSLLSWERGGNTVKGWIVNKAMTTYPVNHKGKWAAKLVEKHNLNLEKSDTGSYRLTKKHIGELEDSKYKEFLLTGDASVLTKLETQKISMELWKEENGGSYLNIQSKDHLSSITFGWMNIEPFYYTASGKPKFDSDTVDNLAELKDEHLEWAKNLKIYNKLTKIKGTYIDRFLDNHEDGVFYPYFKQNGTISGRYGSDLQQLPKPKEDGEDYPTVVKFNNYIRAFLIAGKGRKFIDDDYSSLEPRIFASVTNDDGLKEIYRKNWDFYSTIAIKTEKLNEKRDRYPNGVSADTSAPNFLKKLDAPKRQSAKSYSLGIAYGMSAYALSQTLDIEYKEANRLVKGYLDGFPNLKKWMKHSIDFVTSNGYVKNKLGRVRHLPKAKSIHDKLGDRILDFKFRNQMIKKYGEKVVTDIYRDYKNARNNSLNFQIQSLAASIVNRAALMINRKAEELGIDAWVCAQIHDQLVINVSEEDAQRFAPTVKYIMENNVTLDGVELIADPEIADNMREGH